MRAHLSNSAYGILDYAAQPAAMLLAAPILLHHLGLAAYGLWLIASAAVSAGSIVSSGFGDAVIQRIGRLRATNDLQAIRRVVANMLAINFIFGSVLGALAWLLIPLAVAHITHNDPALRSACLWSLRIGAGLIVVKSVESVFISAQRAFERYAPAVRIGIATRVFTIALTVLLVFQDFGVIALMLLLAVLSTAGAVIQGFALRSHLGPGAFRPSLDRETVRQLGSTGGFTWLQAVAGVLFSQADRLILGATLGASAVAYYGITIQLAQPIHGLTAAGLHFLFPHLASRSATGPLTDLRRPVVLAFTVNVLCASALTFAVIVLGPLMLKHWVGPDFAQHTAAFLPLIAVAFGLLALNVTAHYTLMALGCMRLVTALNVGGGLLMLCTMLALSPSDGVRGAALARLCYGPATLLLYLPLARRLRNVSSLAGGAASLRTVHLEVEEA